MNTCNIIKRAILATTIAVTFSATATQADELFKVQPSAVYHAIKNKSLAETLRQVSQRSGIVFKINTDLGKDVVRQSIAAPDWNAAIKSLLAGYNYTVVQDGKNIKTVIITGRNGSAPMDHHLADTATAPDLIVIEPKLKTLPARYKSFPAGSVMAVDIPVDKIMKIANNSSADFDLPIGQLQVTHDSTVTEEGGSKTWIGHLSDEGKGYRVFLSQGAGGTMGHVVTPEGTYNIESDKDGMYLVDTSKLDHAGFEGDLATPDTAMQGAMTMDAAQSISDLQLAVDAAKKAYDDAQSLATASTALYKSESAKLQPALTAYNAAASKFSAIQTAYNKAIGVYIARPNTTNSSALINAISAMNVATKEYIAALNAYRILLNNLNALNTATKLKVANAEKAKANYDLALKALNNAKTAPPAGTSTSTATTSSDSTVDLMVLYTVKGYTADYAKQRIAYLVTASNQAYIDSGIKMKLRLVYAESTAYVDNNGNNQALDDLANDRGAFAGTSQKRTQYGADLVFLFRPLYAQTAGSCGTTYLEFANGSAPNKRLGYGTIGDGSSKDAAANYYCGINTFTHEIGHSLGLVHDREYSNASGVFNYSYAWGIQGKFGTIMSYKTPNVMYFSTPALATTCAGTPCGFAETNTTQSSDQTKSVNYTAPLVSNFMPTMVSAPVIK